MEGKLYFAGGWKPTGLNGITYVYDPNVDKWSDGQFNTLYHQRGCPVVIGHIIYLVGGFGEAGAVLDKISVGDTRIKTWTTTTNAMPDGGYDFACSEVYLNDGKHGIIYTGELLTYIGFFDLDTEAYSTLSTFDTSAPYYGLLTTPLFAYTGRFVPLLPSVLLCRN